MAVYKVWAANHGADHAADDRAGRSGNDGTRTGADRNAFQRSGLSCDRQRRQRQREDSNFEHRAHDKSP
jgi:hypothetical protein